MGDIGTTAKTRILVVDDSSLVRLYYRSTLEKAGFEVEQAINGIEAMEKVLVTAIRSGDRRRQYAANGRLHFSAFASLRSRTMSRGFRR